MNENIASNDEWTRWGKTDPLYGVASWPGKEKGGSNPWTDEEFYAAGASEFAEFAAIWKRYGLVADSCVEIGCGAGRMTQCLAQIFGTVHAVDISSEIVDYAKSRVTAENIRWQVSDGKTLPLPDRSVTGAFSCHVFQHLPSVDIGMRYFAEAARVLAPGATLFVHLPIHRHPPLHGRLANASRVLHAAYFSLYDLKARYRRWRMRRGGALYMHGLSYDENELLHGLRDLGYSNVEFVTFAMKNHGGLHTCVLATR